MSFLVYVNKPCQTQENNGVKIDHALHKNVTHNVDTSTTPKKAKRVRKTKTDAEITEDPIVTDLKSQYDSLYTQKVQLETELAKTHEHKENLEKINTKLNNTLTKHINTHETKINDLKKELSKSLSEVESLKNKNTLLQNELSKAQTEYPVKYNKLQHELCNLKEENIQLQAQITSMPQVNQLQTEKQKLQKRIVSLEDSITRYKTSEQTLETVLAKLQSKTVAVQNAHDLISMCATREHKTGNKQIAALLHESRDLLHGLLH
jgi:predicted  nucleic acid-binding Zn-ribbon protein